MFSQIHTHTHTTSTHTHTHAKHESIYYQQKVSIKAKNLFITQKAREKERNKQAKYEKNTCINFLLLQTKQKQKQKYIVFNVKFFYCVKPTK